MPRFLRNAFGSISGDLFRTRTSAAESVLGMSVGVVAQGLVFAFPNVLKILFLVRRPGPSSLTL